MAEKKEKRYVSDNAQLMAEWHWEKNTNLDSTQLTLGSHKQPYWKVQTVIHGKLKCKPEHVDTNVPIAPTRNYCLDTTIYLQLTIV